MEKENLDVITIHKLFNLHCKHQKEYNDELEEWEWQECKECILVDIPYYVPHNQPSGFCKRDICFAIWHGKGLISREKKSD